MIIHVTNIVVYFIFLFDISSEYVSLEQIRPTWMGYLLLKSNNDTKK